jgi:hypothetical protein
MLFATAVFISEPRAISWYRLKHNFIYTQEKSIPFHVPGFTNLTNAWQHGVHLSSTDFYPPWIINVESTDVTAFKH